MAKQLTPYETRRLKNIEDNKRVLAELGLLNPYLKLNVSRDPNARQYLKKAPLSKKKTPQKRKIDAVEVTFQPGRRRKSARLRGVPADGLEILDSDEDSDSENRAPRPVAPPRDNSYGHIEGVSVGDWWEMRMECSRAGIHRPFVAGIHGHTEQGAYSVALSGGYEDNIDLGECFTYTGEGGRDLKGTKNKPKNLRTAPQSKDQTLTRGNLALSQSVKTGRPVRVIRGFKLPTVFAPETGYRYDGLYNVTKCWYATGSSGYGVWKFAFTRCLDQSPLPFNITQETCEEKNSGPEVNEPASRAKRPLNEVRTDSDGADDSDSDYTPGRD